MGGPPSVQGVYPPGSPAPGYGGMQQGGASPEYGSSGGYDPSYEAALAKSRPSQYTDGYGTGPSDGPGGQPQPAYGTASAGGGTDLARVAGSIGIAAGIVFIILMIIGVFMMGNFNYYGGYGSEAGIYTWFIIILIILPLLSLLCCMIGGLISLKNRGFGLALAGGILGLLTGALSMFPLMPFGLMLPNIGGVLGLIFGVLFLVMVIVAKDHYIRGSAASGSGHGAGYGGSPPGHGYR